MEGRVLLKCTDCGLTTEIVGEIPDEYIHCFAQAVHREGWAPRPGVDDSSLICGACLKRDYAGHESVDDEEKVHKT